MIDTEPVLCYVRSPWAYFTTQPLDKQYGDGWAKTPYEHNSSTPYEWSPHDEKHERPRWEIVCVAFEGPFATPADGYTNNSPYSISEINKGAVAWLRSDSWVKGDNRVIIPAGTPLSKFVELIRKGGGRVYAEVK